MATVANEKSVVSQGAAKKQVAVEVAAPSRREFLFYIWGASMALLMGESLAGFIWFALPRFKEGEFGGTFTFPGEDVPRADTAPLSIPEGRVWLSNSNDGFLALYAVCTHLGCLPKWEPGNFRFECPCHGSRFELNGDYITGPAPRNMDRFETTIVFSDGTSETSSNGEPIQLNGRTVVSVRVNTGNRINGAAN